MKSVASNHDETMRAMDIPDTPIGILLKRVDFSVTDGPWIAGGAVLKLVSGEDFGFSDIDVFVHSNHEEHAIVAQFNEAIEAAGTVASRSRRQASYTWDSRFGELTVQLVKADDFKDVYALLADFDFTVCQFALVGGKIIGPEIAFRDVEQNILRFNPNRGRHPSGLRLAKYLRRFRPGPNFFTSLLDPGKVEHVGSNLWYPVQHTY